VKIDSTNPVTGASVSETRSRGTEKAAPAAQSNNVTDVRLSEASVGLQSSSEAAPFDVAQVTQIKQAIADGRFTINAGAIAERLVTSARELLDSQRQA
jgi:negative regulator of flagellin synthesis FlgM